MKYIPSILVLMLMAFTGMAQNVVVNGSFETYTTCPTNLGQVMNCSSWRSYITSSPDYFHSCNTGITTSVPLNAFGNQLAAHGSAYTGVVDYYSGNYREYIATTFPPLIVNGLYEVSMSVSLADNYSASNGLGIYFFQNGPLTIPGSQVLTVTPQVSYTGYGNITDKINWVRLTANFLSDSAYTNLVIGGFVNNATMLAGPTPPSNFAYYYIDSVVVKLISYININFSGTGFCANNTINVPYTVPPGYFNSGNVFTLQLSGPTGSFATPINIGSVASVTSGTITGTIPANITNGSGYRIRVISSNPVVTSADNGTNIQISAPGLSSMANSPLCAGSTLLFTSLAVPGSSFSWTGPGSFTSGISNPSISNAQPVHSGDYIVTSTLNGCTEKDTLTVVVNPIPVISSATNNGPLCDGDNLSLTAQSSTSGTYNWTGPGSYTSLLQSPTINNVNAGHQGTYSVTTSLNGCTSAPVNTIVAVNPRPVKPTASNNAPVCTGGILNLFATTTTPGATYNWSGPNSFTSTQQNPVIDPVSVKASGKYAVIATLGNCTSEADTTVVTINTVTYLGAYASPNDTVCEGTLITVVTVPVNGGSNPLFQWFKNGNAIPGATKLTYPTTSAITGDSFYCRMIAGNVCNTPITLFSDKIGITVLPKTPAPVVAISSNPANPLPGNAVTFNAALTNGGSNPQLQWQRNGTDVAGATATSWSTNGLNPYDKINVKLTVTEPCPEANPAYSNTITVNFSTGINEVGTGSTFYIYPNPNSGQFTIKGIDAKEANVQILNSIGQEVYRQTVPNLNGGMEVRPNTKLAKGIYLINIESGGMIKRLRMVVE